MVRNRLRCSFLNSRYPELEGSLEGVPALYKSGLWMGLKDGAIERLRIRLVVRLINRVRGRFVGYLSITFYQVVRRPMPLTGVSGPKTHMPRLLVAAT